MQAPLEMVGLSQTHDFDTIYSIFTVSIFTLQAKIQAANELHYIYTNLYPYQGLLFLTSVQLQIFVVYKLLKLGDQGKYKINH